MTLPSRVADRLVAGIKRFQPILTSAKSRDVNESDTVIIITDMLADVFGYDKYSEITSELCIRGTYCDLAIKIEGKIHILLEAKAIGTDLKEAHLKQAVDYAANAGIEWVALTNGVTWQIYRVIFGQPISQELVAEFDFLALNFKSDSNLETLYLMTKEGLCKSVLNDYHEQRQAMNRFFLGAMVVTDPVLEVVRRELRRVSPGVKIDIEDIRKALVNEVLKREVVEGEKADEARRKIVRSQGKMLRKTKGSCEEVEEVIADPGHLPSQSVQSPNSPPAPGAQ